MNRKQKLVIWVAIVLMVLAFFVPPFTGQPGSQKAGRVHWLVSDEDGVHAFWNMSVPTVIMVNVLAAEWFLILAVAAGLFFTLADEKKKDTPHHE